jgi:tetratricopeptide (TPR) repeat protein
MQPKYFLVTIVCLSGLAVPAIGQTKPTRQQQIAQHAQLAQEYLHEHRPEMAIPELKAVLALDPNNLDALGNLGVLQFFAGDYAGAATHLHAAIRIKPDLWQIRALLGMSERRSGQDAEGREDLEAAFPHLQGSKVQVQVGMELLESYSATGDLSKAANVVAALRAADPTNVSVLYAAYRIYSDLTDEVMLSMMMTAPNSAEAHQMMAHELVRKGNNTAAIANYREALKLNPNLPGLHYELAQLLQDEQTAAGQAEAMEQYKQALAQNSFDEKTYCKLGELADEQSDAQGAFKAYSKAVELQPNDSEALTGLAKAYLLMQQPEKALPLLQRAVELDPTNAVAHFRLSTLYRHAGKEADAKREFELYQKYKDMKSKLSNLYKQMSTPAAANATGSQAEKSSTEK